MLKFLMANTKEITTVLGILMVTIGIGLHDLGTGLASGGLLLVGVILYAVHKGA